MNSLTVICNTNILGIEQRNMANSIFLYNKYTADTTLISRITYFFLDLSCLFSFIELWKKAIFTDQLSNKETSVLTIQDTFSNFISWKMSSMLQNVTLQSNQLIQYILYIVIYLPQFLVCFYYWVGRSDPFFSLSIQAIHLKINLEWIR